MRLLDTDVCVDIRRGYPPALAWLAALTEAPGISGFVMLELMRGCANQREMRRLQRDMALFRIHWPTVDIDSRTASAKAGASSDVKGRSRKRPVCSWVMRKL